MQSYAIRKLFHFCWLRCPLFFWMKNNRFRKYSIYDINIIWDSIIWDSIMWKILHIRVKVIIYTVSHIHYNVYAIPKCTRCPHICTIYYKIYFSYFRLIFRLVKKTFKKWKLYVVKLFIVLNRFYTYAYTHA